MITWRNPAAFAGLLALAAPIVIHLLWRQRARRVPFPSLRFVSQVSSTAVRVRRVSDLLLLAVRLAILALAVAALAQPVVLTESRIATWNARTARAIVVDTSNSMRPHAADVHERIEAEARGAAQMMRVDSADLRQGIAQAATLLEAATPARREIVVISDLQAGSLDAAGMIAVPTLVGIRFVQVGSLPAERRFVSSPLMSGERHATVLSGPSTALKVVEGPPPREGLRLVVAQRDTTSVERLLQVVADAGTPAPSADEPIVIRFRGAPLVAAADAMRESWMRGTVTRLLDTVADDYGLKFSETPARELLVNADHEPSSLAAAAVVRAVLIARAGPIARSEEEVLAVPPADLAAWSREAPPVGPDIASDADVSDARWVWLAVLALLGLEAWLRRSAPAAVEQGIRSNAA